MYLTFHLTAFETEFVVPRVPNEIRHFAMKLSWINGYCPDSILSFHSLSWVFFFEFCLCSWWDLWAHRYLVVAHHPTYHGINLVAEQAFAFPINLFAVKKQNCCSEENPNPRTNKPTKTAQLSKIVQRVKSNFCCKNELGQSAGTQRHRQAVSACVTGNRSERKAWNLNSSCSSASALSHWYDSHWQCSR